MNLGKRRKVVLCLIGLLYLNSRAVRMTSGLHLKPWKLQKMITMLETSASSNGNPMTVDQLKTELADLKMRFQQYEELLAALATERSNQQWVYFLELKAG